MGFFDLPFPIFSFLNNFLKRFLSQEGLLLLWGLLGACMSMGIYSLVSSQRSLARLKQNIVVVRKDISRYSGEFAGFARLASRLLTLSLKQVGLTLGPAMVGAIPVIFILVWLSNTFGLILPKNEVVRVTFFPRDVVIESVTAGHPGGKEGVWYVCWGSVAERLRVVESPGQEVASLKPNVYVALVHKKKWWNLFLGNLAGYIDDSSKLERIKFDFKHPEYIPFGPKWMRGWEVIFLSAVFIVSASIKIIFKIN